MSLVKIDDRPARRAARADRLRRHHRCRRRAEHGRHPARVERRRDRLRRRRSVGDPGCPHRGRVAHHRRRPGRAEARHGAEARCHRHHRPGRRRRPLAGDRSHRWTRRRLRVRGHRPPGSHHPGVHVHACRRYDRRGRGIALRREHHHPELPAVLAGEAAPGLGLRLGAGAARLPPPDRPRRDRQARPRRTWSAGRCRSTTSTTACARCRTARSSARSWR